MRSLISLMKPQTRVQHISQSRSEQNSFKRSTYSRRKKKFVTEAKKKSIDESDTKAPLPPKIADSQDEDMSCAFVIITVDNERFTDRSFISISIQSIPGLMRVISWLLEGLDLEIFEAKITTDQDSFVCMEFEIVEKTGDDKFVKICDPDAVKERLEDYLNFCLSNEQEAAFGIKTRRGVCVDNETSKDTTIAMVAVNSSPVKTLLPISSAVTALKLKIDSATLIDAEETGSGKKWKFELVNAESGDKLSSQEANALMYTLTLLVQSATNLSGTGKSSSAAARDIEMPIGV
jgi:hypothetical protein